MCGISIPGNINDRVSIGTRNKSNGACSSRQWSRASCILPSSLSLHSPFPLGTAAPSAVSRSYSIYFTSTFYSIFSSTAAGTVLSIETRTYTLTKSGDTSGTFTRQNLRRLCKRARASVRQENLRKSWAISPLTPRSTAKNFSPGLVDISLVLLAYSEMESIYNFANGHSVLPLATLRYHSRKVYLYVEKLGAYRAKKCGKNE